NPTFREIVARVKQGSLEAYDHHDLPFARLLEALQPERDLSRTPYTQVVFLMLGSIRPTQQKDDGRGELTVAPYWVDAQRTQFDINFALWEHRNILTGLVEYSSDIFDGTTLDRLKEQYRLLLDGALADPDRRLWDLPLLADGERQQLVAEWGARESAGDDAVAGSASLHARFAAQAAKSPQAEAVASDGEALSYAELDRRSDRLARRLVAAGAHGELVALAAERGSDLVVAILGVLRAGAAYVPLDPALPAERIAFVLADSGAALLLADAASLDRLPVWSGRTLAIAEGEVADEDYRGAPFAALPTPGPGAPAYVIYTSGSTGRPKGVVVTHGNVLRLFTATERWFGFGAADVWTLFHSFAFDFSVWEMWGALLYGGRLVVVPQPVSRSPQAFLALLAAERVTVLNQTPSAFRQLLAVATAAGAPALPELRHVIFGGEALDARSLGPWLARYGDGSDRSGPALVIMYGITETTVHVTWHRVLRDEIESGWGSRIGVPIPDLSVHVLDPYGRPAPI
ncbi:MAG TPA: AMP-binding protein, partial [Thermoanaerobaculia bacterium]